MRLVPIATALVLAGIATGRAVARYACTLECAGQGRGISAIVALGGDQFLVLERNNRGVGVGANVASPDKNVFEIDLSGAADVTGINLPATGNFAGAVTKVAKVAKVMDLDANRPFLGGRSPEKWEGLAVGPQLTPNLYLMLAGTDNDYSVTQSGKGEQFDEWFRFSDADPSASAILCPIGFTIGCTFANGSAATVTGDYSLLPGILRTCTVNIADYVAPVPEPSSLALAAGALAIPGLRRRRH